MIEQGPQGQPSDQDNEADNTADETGIISYPHGITADWLIQKTKHLNDAHKTWFANSLLNIEDNYKLYELKQVAGTLPNGTNIPIVTEIVDTMVSRLVPPLVNRETFVNAIPIDPDLQAAGDYDTQETVTDFINESIGNTDDFADKIDETLKGLMLEDVAIVETKWSITVKTEQRAQRAPDPMNPIAPPIVSMVPVSYEIGRPDFEPVSIRMMAWDPRCKTSIADSPFIRKRTMVSINGLLQMQKDGVIQDVDEIAKKSNKAMTPENPTDPDAKQSQAVDSRQLPAVGWDDGVWELDEWWGTLAWKDEAGAFKTGEYQFWIVGGDTVVKFRDNPLIPQRKPFATIKASRIPGQLLAKGPVDVVKDMQKALNNNTANLEQLIKNASYSPTFYEPVSGLDGRRVSLQSNSLIPVLSVNGIKRFEPAVQAIDLIQKYIDFIIGQMREATAANDQSQGINTSGSGDTTATEAQILAQGSNTRFGYLTEMINASCFGEIAEQYFYLWKQFGEPGKMVVKDGSNDGKGYLIQPEDLQGCYVFKAVPTQSQQAKLQHFQQLNGFVQQLIQLQMQAPQMLVDNAGKPKQLDLYDFLVNQMLPLVNVQARGLFKDAPPPPQMMLGAGPPAPGPQPMPPSIEPAPMAMQ